MKIVTRDGFLYRLYLSGKEEEEEEQQGEVEQGERTLITEATRRVLSSTTICITNDQIVVRLDGDQEFFKAVVYDRWDVKKPMIEKEPG